MTSALKVLKRIITLLLSALFLVIFFGVCFSGPFHEADINEQPLFGSAQIQLSCGRYSINTKELRAVVTANDLQLLDCFTKLESCDFSGSSCFSEISEWAERHPDIRVEYTVTLPDGTILSRESTYVDFSAFSSLELEPVARTLSCLPKLQLVKLGTLGAGGLGIDDLKLLESTAPQAAFDYSVNIDGTVVDSKTEEIDLSKLKHSDAPDIAAVLAGMKSLKKIELGSQSDAPDALTWDDILSFKLACPNAVMQYSFTLYGLETDLNAEKLDYYYKPIDDNGELLYKVLPCMNRLTIVDMDSSGVADEYMGKLRESFPQIKFIWRVRFGERYSVRTDCTRILASKPTVGGMIYDPTPLQYCTDVVYLDIGHNEEMTSLDFVANMPKLEVLIVAMSDITDISALANCPELDYLELNSTEVGDLSPLKNLTKLRHLNICCSPNVTDISPLYGLTQLERFWIGSLTPVPAEQVAEMQRCAPGCKIDTTTEDPHGNCWRYTRYDPDEPKYYWVERYELLREQLGYNYQEYSFYWLDPLCQEKAPAEYAGMFGKEVYGLS